MNQVFFSLCEHVLKKVGGSRFLCFVKNGEVPKAISNYSITFLNHHTVCYITRTQNERGSLSPVPTKHSSVSIIVAQAAAMPDGSNNRSAESETQKKDNRI